MKHVVNHVISDIAAHLTLIARRRSRNRRLRRGKRSPAWHLETSWKILKPPKTWQLIDRMFKWLNAPGGGRQTGETRHLHLPAAGASQLHGPGWERAAVFTLEILWAVSHMSHMYTYVYICHICHICHMVSLFSLETSPNPELKGRFSDFFFKQGKIHRFSGLMTRIYGPAQGDGLTARLCSYGGALGPPLDSLWILEDLLASAIIS